MRISVGFVFLQIDQTGNQFIFWNKYFIGFQGVGGGGT